ncbi:isochorismate synthase [Dyadobacter jejuensis]|uniref:isochorismate synthase n=1 Tax=Dyadobacter jejuensis TaxID=1082580 RepID=A0A316AK76_9BACT|nr:chorismate-binding protein [Dyadobacter jejuensis]PWJ57414.1 isochorismate synthase [Dyadobacter jejuensis]
MIAVHPKVTRSLQDYKMETIWQAISNLGLPGAVWKLPYESSIKVLVSFNADLRMVEPDLDKLPPGFMIAPFLWNSTQPVSFMEGDLLMDYAMTGTAPKVDPFAHDQDHPKIVELMEEAEKCSKTTPSQSVTPKFWPIEAQTSAHDKRHFISNVQKAVSAIEKGEFQKVVLSRTKQLGFDDHFEAIKAFQKLTSQYPHAFVSLVNLPKQKELWLGASPELLLSTTHAGTFKTMSLAGTQPAIDSKGGNIQKNEIRWGQKEIEEHALVSRYIVECFKKIRLREYLETGPKSTQAGNLYHLRTDFEVNAHEVHFEELGSVMLKLLHPTSAICGTPKESALAFISAQEGFDRKLYSGFLGPVNIEEATKLFVNLRTVHLKDHLATFYAGAGITEDSNAENEWNETELKCDTLLQVIAAM